MKDNIGIATVKIHHLYKDKTLTDREFRKKTKEILNKFRDEVLNDNKEYIKKLQVSVNELETIKRILK